MSQSSSFHRSNKPSRKSRHGSSVRPRVIPSKASRQHSKQTMNELKSAAAEPTAFGQEQFIAQNNQKILASLFDEKSLSRSNNPIFVASFHSRNGSPRMSPRFKKKSISDIPVSRRKPRSNRSDCLDNYDAAESSNPSFELSSMSSVGYDDEIDYMRYDNPTDVVDKTSTRTVATQPLSAASLDLRKKTRPSAVETKRKITRNPTIVAVGHTPRGKATQKRDENKEVRKNKGRRRTWQWVNPFAKNPFLLDVRRSQVFRNKEER